MSRFVHGGNVSANGIRQHYLRYGGKGQPLVLVPGITSPAITWGFVAEALAEHHDVHVLDVRGRGLSETGPHLGYDLDSYAADVAAFAEAMGFDTYDLVGHSMGARIGIRLARNAPQRLRRLVLIDPPATGPGRRPYPAPLGWYVDSIRICRAGADWRALLPFSPSWTEAQLRLRAEWLHSCDEQAVIETYERFHSEDIFGDLPWIRVPALLMVAGNGVIDEAECAAFAAGAPAMRIVTVPRAGHMIPWDDEAGFFAAFGDFLDNRFTPYAPSVGKDRA